MKLSILIPTRNRAGFLRDAINSVLAEVMDMPDVEILVSDNASTDQTQALLEEFSGRIVPFFQASDLGMCGNWNFLMEKSRGEFIKLMGDDDALLPGGIKREIAALQSASDIALVSSARWEGNPPLGQYLNNPTSWDGILKQTYPQKVALTPKQAFREMIFRENIFGTPTSVMFRKSALPRFPTNWSYAVDWAGWIEALNYGGAIVLPEPNCVFRIHSNNLTKKFLATDQDIKEVILLRKISFDKFAGSYWLRAYLLFVSMYRWARRLVRKLIQQR